jgi:hypothetical protein
MGFIKFSEYKKSVILVFLPFPTADLIENSQQCYEIYSVSVNSYFVCVNYCWIKLLRFIEIDLFALCLPTSVTQLCRCCINLIVTVEKGFHIVQCWGFTGSVLHQLYTLLH